jgi:hypothetical protein
MILFTSTTASTRGRRSASCARHRPLATPPNTSRIPPPELTAPSEYPDLIHAFIWIDPEDRSNDRFFLLTLLQLQETIAKNYAAYLKRQGGSRPRNWESTHCSVKLEHLPAFEENWQLIGDRLQSAR